LAAILLVVSYNMGEWREIPEFLKLSRLEIATWLITFLLTVFADLTVAVEVGMIMAAFVFIRKVTATTTVTQVTHDYIREGYMHILQHKEIPNYVAIFRIHGPFLFGATDKLDEIVSHLSQLPPVRAALQKPIYGPTLERLLKLNGVGGFVHRADRKPL
jgi:sulfate permease, SulP family